MNENTARVRELYAAFKRGDQNAVADAMTDDVVWDAAGEQRFGREEVRTFLETVRAAADLRTLEPREFITEGGRVAVAGTCSGTAKATGREFVAGWLAVFELRGDKVARFQALTDTQALASAFDTGKSAFEGVPGVP